MDLVGNLVVDVVASLILAALNWLGRYLSMHWRPNPRSRPLSLLGLGVLWLLTNVWVIRTENVEPFSFFLLTTLTLLFVLWREVWPLYRVGIQGADLKVSSGLDYKRALALCKNELDFLGTGAAKLTATGPDFEQALVRCHRAGRPVRFLLMDLGHGSPGLEEAARKEGVAPDEYRHRVVDSLRRIAQLRERRSLNIEVRLYKELPQFRLMFIDDAICLVSYNVYGEGDGSTLPQLHIVKRPTQRDVSSFYYPFREIFWSIWQKSEPWDFVRWLDE